MKETPDEFSTKHQQHRAATRTAVVLGVIAVAIYVWGIVSRL
jgi:hypothetical protein